MYKALKRISLPGVRTLDSVSLQLSAILILLMLSGCWSIPISYYDATTYTQLTALKAETALLVKSFDTKPISENKDNIEKVTLNLRKAYEYEYGKGNPNSDTATQFKKIIELFDEDITDYQKYGPNSLKLGKIYFSEASGVLGQAFDIAIATENLKNKDKR